MAGQRQDPVGIALGRLRGPRKLRPCFAGGSQSRLLTCGAGLTPHLLRLGARRRPRQTCLRARGAGTGFHIAGRNCGGGKRSFLTGGIALYGHAARLGVSLANAD